MANKHSGLRWVLTDIAVGLGSGLLIAALVVATIQAVHP